MNAPQAERLVGDCNWGLVLDEERAYEDFHDGYVRTQNACEARNEREANAQMQGFKPPFTRHENVEPDRTTARVVIGYLIFAALCTVAVVAALHYFR